MLSTQTEFLAATSLANALEGIGVPDAIFLGGGTSTALLHKTRMIDPARVVWLGAIADLQGITLTENEVRIGAMATAAQIATSSELKRSLPGVAQAAAVIGNARVRAMATLGGALAHADPRQDLPPALVSAGAVVHMKTRSASRSIPLAQFYKGFLETVLTADELITHVIVPVVRGRKSAYLRYTPTSEGDYPTVGVAASLDMGENGNTISASSIALCGVGQVPILATEAMESLVGALAGTKAFAEAASLVRSAVNPHDDERGSAAYKREMAVLWTKRALQACIS